MTQAVNRFFDSIQGAANESQASLVSLFVYYLTVELGQKSATVKEVCDCFSACDLAVPAGVAARLSEGLKSKPKKFIKSDGGYKLERHMRVALAEKLGANAATLQTSATLRSLESKLQEGATKDFLKETIDCFETGANRATVIMVWILAVDHLFSHIIKHKLKEFNTALAASKGIKINIVVVRDDFMEIKEVKFIELCRAAKIITNDVRKILDVNLGIRNSCAHPSSVKVRSAKVISVVEDLVENVVLKYPV